MKTACALIGILMLAGCDRYGPPAKAYKDWKDRWTVATGIPFSGLEGPCVEKVEQRDRRTIYSSLPTSQCFRMTEPRRWRGLWRNEFEGSRFCPAPARACIFDTIGNRIWLDAEKELEGYPAPNGKLYEVEFVGRRTLHEGNYGHMGVFDHEIVVDRMISMKEVKE